MAQDLLQRPGVWTVPGPPLHPLTSLAGTSPAALLAALSRRAPAGAAAYKTGQHSPLEGDGRLVPSSSSFPVRAPRRDGISLVVEEFHPRKPIRPMMAGSSRAEGRGVAGRGARLEEPK